MKCSECDSSIEAEEVPGRCGGVTYLFDFKMCSEIARRIGDDWVGVIYDDTILCRPCLRTYRYPGVTKKR